MKNPAILLGIWTILWSPAVAETPAVITREQIEADWVLQDYVRGLAALPNVPLTGLSTAQDAAGGCDGLKTGTYGFHTSNDESPWWQVDLGQVTAVDRVVVWNRCDGNVQARAARLKLLASPDGTTWSELYRHDGTPFLGQSDGRPLSISLGGAEARFIRVQLPEKTYLHLDEVEVFAVGSEENVALGRKADQSSASQWSTVDTALPVKLAIPEKPAYPIDQVIERGLRLAESLRALGADVTHDESALREVAAQSKALAADVPDSTRRELYLRARWAVRRMTMANPLLDFDDLLLVKRVPGTFTHMSDQHYGWFSRPGGGLFVLHGFKTDQPRLRQLAADLPPGSVQGPDLSYDGKRILFAHCRHYPGLNDEPNKLDKNNVPEDAFYQLYEVGLDGSGLRRLTEGKYDSFDGRYLPDGRIVFLSTRRGQYVQCGPESAAEAAAGASPDCYVRCGGGPERPVAVYTLHVMNADGSALRPLSPFEMFEWTPSVDHDGSILYARWDYVDRYNMPYMSLWSTLPDGTHTRAVYGNYTTNPHCVFEARRIPGSSKILFTASAHHAQTSGSLVLLDPRVGADGPEPLVRLTPEVEFPESEGWPQTYFANPYPLSENHYLVAWSASPLPRGTPRPLWGMPGPPNDLGIYLFDAFGNLNLIYRDPEISSMYPLPIRPRPLPPAVSLASEWEGEQQGTVVVSDVYQGLAGIARRNVRALRLVGVPPKTHPTMNSPLMGLTRDDPGKFVLGTVPVEADGSASFRVPSGVSFFVQALDEQGMAVQTMRSAIYLQPGERISCVGCHESRHTAPPNRLPAAVFREPSKITPGPHGSWPLDYQVLVQPVLDKHCVACHDPNAKDAASPDLTARSSYDSLSKYGKPSLADHVLARYAAGRSERDAGAAATNPLWPLLDAGHHDVALGPEDRQRLATWMDTYGQRQGHFDQQQQERLKRLRESAASLLAEQTGE